MKEMKPLEALEYVEHFSRRDDNDVGIHIKLDKKIVVIKQALERLDKIDSIDLDEALADIKIIEDEILAHNLVGLTSLINLIKQMKDE